MRKGDWMQTFTGRQYWPLDPRADEVDPVDIVHHLSMTCRYCGAVERFYSVAEHTLGVLHVGLREAQRRQWPGLGHIGQHLLLHDAAEAYCHDLIRPIKRSVTGYDEVEGLNHHVICERFDVDGVQHWLSRLIKQADNAMLLAEQAQLMKSPPASWAKVDVSVTMLTDAHLYLYRTRWQPWRKWRWWIKRAMLREMRRLGLV